MTSDEVWQTIRTSDGRALEVVSQGPSDALPLVFHGGTPIAAVLYPPIVDAAIDAGLRFITYSRPGYASSDPMPGRSVADAAADVAAILDALGAERFVTIGWSGGGPHALACAALLPDRCAAAATIAAVAPYPAAGIDWLAGMGEENVEEFGAALQGEDALSAYLKEEAVGLSQVTASDLDDALGDLVSDVDRASLTGRFAEWAAASFRKAVEHRHRRLARRRPGIRQAVGLRPRADQAPGRVVAGRRGPDGAVLARPVAGRAPADRASHACSRARDISRWESARSGGSSRTSSGWPSSTLPAAGAPLGQVRTLGAERRVVAVARVEPRVVRQRAEHPLLDVVDERGEVLRAVRACRRRRGTASRR